MKFNSFYKPLYPTFNIALISLYIFIGWMRDINPHGLPSFLFCNLEVKNKGTKCFWLNLSLSFVPLDYRHSTLFLPSYCETTSAWKEHFVPNLKQKNISGASLSSSILID